MLRERGFFAQLVMSRSGSYHVKEATVFEALLVLK